MVASLSTRDGRSPIELRRRDGVFRRPFVVVVVVGRLLINRVVDDVAATQHNSFRPANDGRTDSRSVVRRVTRRATCFHLVDVARRLLLRYTQPFYSRCIQVDLC